MQEWYKVTYCGPRIEDRLKIWKRSGGKAYVSSSITLTQNVKRKIFKRMSHV